MEFPDRPLDIPDLEGLLDLSGEPCASIYLPCRPEAGGQEARTRFKNLASEAERELIARGLRSSDAAALLEPGRALLGDSGFWRHLDRGLAFFASPDAHRVMRLPLSFEPRQHVGARPYLRPLMPLLAEAQRFLILALSRGAVRLLAADRFHVRELSLDGLPRSQSDALAADDPERRLQHHTASAPGGSGRGTAVFHGHGEGAGSDEDMARDRRYVQAIDAVLAPWIARRPRPLVLAGEERLLAAYRKHAKASGIVEGAILGNPESRPARALHADAWPLVEPIFTRDRRAAHEAIEASLGTGLASDQLEVILPAAHQGWIEQLFLVEGESVWGRFEPSTHRIDRSDPDAPGATELLEEAALRCLRQGGSVHLVEREAMPGEGVAAAKLRFAVPVARPSSAPGEARAEVD